jgi:hypothetical protein
MKSDHSEEKTGVGYFLQKKSNSNEKKTTVFHTGGRTRSWSKKMKRRTHKKSKQELYPKKIFIKPLK